MSDPANLCPGWAEKLAAAQQDMTCDVLGLTYARLAYGPDHDFPVKPRCSDCAAAIGQLHVEGCAVERCPRCRGQRISCMCHDKARAAQQRRQSS